MKGRTRWALLSLVVVLLPLVFLAPPSRGQVVTPNTSVITGISYRNDTSPLLRDMEPVLAGSGGEREANENPKVPSGHHDNPDEVVQSQPAPLPNMPGTTLNFDGIPFPGVGCNCAPPDTNGEVGLNAVRADRQRRLPGLRQGHRRLGSRTVGHLHDLESAFGGVCETNGHGDPVVALRSARQPLADQPVRRHLASLPTSASPSRPRSDATGTYYRYGFHLGSNFFDYPKIGVWPDAYYMSMNVFNSSGTAYLGPQPFAFDRDGDARRRTRPRSSARHHRRPRRIPTSRPIWTVRPSRRFGRPRTFVEFPGAGTYKVFHFHADFGVPANTTFTLFANASAGRLHGALPDDASVCAPARCHLRLPTSTASATG